MLSLPRANVTWQNCRGPCKPLIAKPQWAVWRWIRRPNGRWTKPPFQSLDPKHHASTKDPNTWSEYASALATVQAGDADGVSFIMTAADPLAAMDLDNCRDPQTHSIDIWAQNFFDVARHTYAEVTPSGAGCRIWGLTAPGTEPVNRKFTLEIDGKQIAAELFRRTPKVLTVTGYRLDTIRELGNIDRAFKWATVWGERRKAAAAEAAAAAAAQVNGYGFNSNGPGYSVELIERIVREGAGSANRSDMFHTVVGHYLGCGWSLEQIDEHLRQFPEGIADKYLGESRLSREISRSAGKYNARALPLLNGWQEPEEIVEVQEKDRPEPEPASPAPKTPDPANDDIAELEEPELSPAPETQDDDELDEFEDLGELDEKPRQDPKLPPLYAHGDPDPRPLKPWLIKHLMPAVGHGLLSGQWGAGKTFVVFDLAAALWSGQPFLGHVVKRQCGVLLIAAEGASEVRLRLDAVVRRRQLQRAPFRWYEMTPLLLQKGAAETLIAMARQADNSLQAEFGLPLGLVVIDTVAACAGYARAGDENDPAAAQAVMNVLKAIAQTLDCFTLGVDHFGKDVSAGTRGASSKESAADVVLSCLGDKALSGSVTNTRLAVRKHGVASRARNTPSPCVRWRRLSRTRTGSRSRRWWWIGCLQARQAAVPGLGLIPGLKAGDRISAPRCCG